MRTQEITTNKLSDFGPRERGMLVDLLTAWEKQGLPDDFYDYEVEAMMNRNSGCVFLTNQEFQVAMMNGDKLEMWHSCPNCGHEGFSEDCQINENNECNECAPNDDKGLSKEQVEEMGFRFVGVEEILSHKSEAK